MIDEFAKGNLHGRLRRDREALIWKLDGLSEYDARRPLTATGTNLLGLVKHVATVEARYFGEVFDRPSPEPLPRWQDHNGSDMWATEDETRDQITGFYRRTWEHADATISELPLDAPGHVPWWPEPYELVRDSGWGTVPGRWHDPVVAIMINRAVLAHRQFTGISRRHLACLVEELAVPWQAGLEGRRHAARGGARKRAAGAGARHQLVFVDRLVATLIHLRHDLPHSVLGLLFGVDRSTVTRAIAEIRALLAERGRAVPERPGLRLRTLTDVFAYAQAEGVELRLDATEIQVRRPPANRGGRRAFVSGKKKQNTMKATVIADRRGRTLWTDTLRPGRMHDATAARNEGIAVCFQHFPGVEVLLDDGYLGLSRDHRGQAITPPRKPRPGALPGRVEQWERDRHWHSSDRITVEHALADHKRWKQLMRWTHRRDRLPDTYRAIAGLVSDRTIAS